MGWDNDLQNFIGKVFLKPDVAPFLTNHHPAVPLKRSDHPVVPRTRDFGHSVISSGFGTCHRRNVVFDRFQIKLDSLPDVRECFLTCVSFADASG